MGTVNRPAAPLHVLVVGDAADATDTAESLVEVLARSGFEVLVATDAEGAFRAVEADPPDVMVTDLALSDMDGLEVARWVRASRVRSAPTRRGDRAPGGGEAVPGRVRLGDTEAGRAGRAGGRAEAVRRVLA